MNKKIFILIISIVIIAVGIAMTDIYISNKQFRPNLPDLPPQPKSTDIAPETGLVSPNDPSISIDKETGWQIYHSKDYGFEMKFPSDWRMKIYGSGDFTAGSDLAGFGFAPETVPYDTLINLYIEQGPLEKKLKGLVEVAGWKTEQEKHRENGIDIVKIYSEDALSGYGFIYYGYIFENQGLMFTFLGGGERTDVTDVFESMMDSFEFVE